MSFLTSMTFSHRKKKKKNHIFLLLKIILVCNFMRVHDVHDERNFITEWNTPFKTKIRSILYYNKFSNIPLQNLFNLWFASVTLCVFPFLIYVVFVHLPFSFFTFLHIPASQKKNLCWHSSPHLQICRGISKQFPHIRLPLTPPFFFCL